MTPTRGPNGYRRYVSADIDRLQEILLLRHIGVGVAEMYVADERFTSYYDEVVKGCAAWLRDAVIARAR
ncbi:MULTISPECIES: MerR family transcriptional regulator [Actinomycetota]|uniref:MerR family transcriptional regulator n=1 Tax=Actinomycetota TaxID=201174 RepID=UPI00374E7F78